MRRDALRASTPLPPSAWAGVLGLALGLTALASLGSGSLALSPGAVLVALTDDGAPAAHRLAVLELRGPRLVAALGVGAALGLSGAILQACLRNPLAEPGLIGVNAGASLAAVSLIAAGAAAGTAAVSGAAFAGGLIAALVVYGLAWRGGAAPWRLVLTGVGVSAVAYALITLVTLFSGVADVQRALAWLAGSLHGRGWGEAGLLWAQLVLLTPLALVAARWLDLLALGDAHATGLGLAVERARLGLIALAVALAAAAVAIAGAVGFVGLLAPHLARLVVGPLAGRALPIAALNGALILALADLLGRTALAPTELPAGVVVSILGAPYLLWLMRRSAHG